MNLLRSPFTAGALVLAAAAAVYGEDKSTADTAPSSAAIRFEGTDLRVGSLPPVSFHGFASQGFLYSSEYNYLGDTTHGSFLLTEVGLNASVNPFPRTRITAQAFLYDVGQEVGKYQPQLDYASAEYTFGQSLGVRAGRIRRPQGIYNSVQDVDLARTAVLLPQGLYDARFRDFYLTTDGGEFFGTIPLGKGGSLSYEAYGGVCSPRMDGGMANYYRSMVPSYVSLDSIESFPEGGVQLWYNTPLSGLRVGASALYGAEMAFDTTVTTLLGQVNSVAHDDVAMYQGSVEYAWKSWTFQGEYMARIMYPEVPTTIMPGSTLTDAWYVGASYRFNKWVEAGTYYTEYYADDTQRDNSRQFQKDLALSLRFDPRDWWIFKIEGHYLNGTALLNDNTQSNARDGRDWFMLAVKTTLSF